MIFNPLFFSLINSKNINDISNSFSEGKLKGEFSENKISNGFFQKIPKYLFSDIMNVLLVKDEKTNQANENYSQSDTKKFSTQSVAKEMDSNKMDLVYSFINDLSLQDVFGSKVEEIKSKLKESILNNTSVEITIDKNILKNFVDKLISTKNNEVKIVLNNNESRDNINITEEKNNKNSLNDKNKISDKENIYIPLEKDKQINLISLASNALPLNFIDMLDGGKIIIENNILNNESENELVIEIESYKENDFNSANQFKLKMNIVPNKNFGTDIQNVNNELINYSENEKIEKLQSNSMKHSSGIDIFLGNNKIISSDNLIFSEEHIDLQNRLILEKPDTTSDKKIEINHQGIHPDFVGKSVPTTATTEIDELQTIPKSSSFQVKIILNNLFEKTNSLIQFDKNNLSSEINNFKLNTDEIVNNSKKLNSKNENESEILILPDETKISKQKINENGLENIKYISNPKVVNPHEIYDKKIYSASKYIKYFKNIDDLDTMSKKTEKFNLENGNINHPLEEKEFQALREKIKINSPEIQPKSDKPLVQKNENELSFIDRNLKHQQSINNKLEIENINSGSNEPKSDEPLANKVNVKTNVVNEKEQTNYFSNDKNESNNKDNDSTYDFNRNIKNENDEDRIPKSRDTLKENVSSEPHSEKIINQTKTDFISNINGKEILKSEIINLQKAEVNPKYFNQEKIIEISEIFKEVSSLISKKENGTIKLQIKPESLGKILITIDSAKEIMNARIEVENKSVQALLENNINQLYSNINQNGVQFSSIQIFLNQGESKNYRPNFSKKKLSEENDNALNNEEEKNTSRKLGYNTYEYLI